MHTVSSIIPFPHLSKLSFFTRVQIILHYMFSTCVQIILLYIRAGQISTKHLKTSVQHFFATCRLPRLHKFRRCYRNRHTFFGPSETIGVYISKSFFFKAKIAITKNGIGKRSNRSMFWSRFFPEI